MTFYNKFTILSADEAYSLYTFIKDTDGDILELGRFYGGYWSGFITNLRATVGSAVYDSTSSTVTAPSSPLPAVAASRSS
jgi:hypothetical protein